MACEVQGDFSTNNSKGEPPSVNLSAWHPLWQQRWTALVAGDSNRGHRGICYRKLVEGFVLFLLLCKEN